MQDVSEDIVLVGEVSGLFGLKGWVKVFSYTQPRENIIEYNPWWLKTDRGWTEIQVEQAQKHGKGIIASLHEYTDPELSSRLIGCDIGLHKSQLPALQKDEFYWNDLIGCQVVNQEGLNLGVVERLIETGSNDVLVVQGESECLVPYIKDQVIKNIDLDKKLIQVDWDPDY